MPTRSSTAVWQGSLEEGNGEVVSTHFTLPYTFPGRLQDGQTRGTNPEELIAAAQSLCYTQALAARLNNQNAQFTQIEAATKVTLTPSGLRLKISRITITAIVTSETLTEQELADHAKSAKDNCPVSLALAAVNIDLKTELKRSPSGE